MNSLELTEAECAAGRTAPRVSLDDIYANVSRELYVIGSDLAVVADVPDHPSLGVLTICLLVLQNGFTILGKSAPASPENFNEELGRKLAHEDAIRQVWPLMGYELRERLARAGTLASAELSQMVEGRPSGPQAGADGRNLDIGLAMLAARAGKRVAREGWNGGGQFVYLVPAAAYPVQTGAAKAHYGEGSMVPYREYLALKTAQGDVATWSPSVSDTLASDWFVITDPTEA